MLLIPLILVALVLVGMTGFGIWAYMERQDFKDNVDRKIAAAVEVAKKQNSSEKDNEFAQKEKEPLKEYKGPAAFGSVVVMYPKTWSAYVTEGTTGSNPIDGYFSPNFVPGTATNTAYALRLQVVNTAYEQEVKRFDSQIRSGKVVATPYIPAKVPTVTGMRFDGEIGNNKVGSMVVLPMRDKTLKLWTESPNYVPDFNNFILPNYSFEQ